MVRFTLFVLMFALPTVTMATSNSHHSPLRGSENPGRSSSVEGEQHKILGIDVAATNEGLVGGGSQSSKCPVHRIMRQSGSVLHSIAQAIFPGGCPIKTKKEI